MSRPRPFATFSAWSEYRSLNLPVGGRKLLGKPVSGVKWSMTSVTASTGERQRQTTPPNPLRRAPQLRPAEVARVRFGLGKAAPSSEDAGRHIAGISTTDHRGRLEPEC